MMLTTIRNARHAIAGLRNHNSSHLRATLQLCLRQLRAAGVRLHAYRDLTDLDYALCAARDSIQAPIKKSEQRRLTSSVSVSRFA